MFEKTKDNLTKMVAKGIEKNVYKKLAEENPKALKMLQDVLMERLEVINKTLDRKGGV